MKIDITPLFQRNGAVLPLEFTEWEDGNSDYLGVVEFVEPVKIEGTLKNENEVFVLEAKGGTGSCCGATVALRLSEKSFASRSRNVLLIQAVKTKRQKLFREIRSILRTLLKEASWRFFP